MKNILIIFFCLIACVTNAQPKGMWDYPVKPGMEGWKKFQSAEEMINSCQIPDVVLSSLTTEELADLCLRYPLIDYVFAFDNLNSGLDKLFSDFNGIRELYNKRDVSNNLLNRYVQLIQTFSFLDGKNTDYEKGEFIVRVSLFEVLLSRCVERNVEAKENSKAILRTLVAGYEGKLRYADYFRGVGFRSNVYSRTQIITEMSKQNLDKIPQKGKNPAKFSGMADEQTLQILDELSYQLIK